MQPSDEPDAVPPQGTPDVGSEEPGPRAWSAARNHNYSVLIMHLAVAFVVESLNSFRGAAQNFVLLSEYFALACPCYSSIRGLGVESRTL